MARELVDRMPSDLAQVTIYFAIDGMTHHEIADLLGCSRRHVGHLLERAVQWARALDEVGTSSTSTARGHFAFKYRSNQRTIASCSRT
jgi:hypothetical protein